MGDLKEALADFVLSEAAGLAVQIEEDGYALYQKALDLTENPRAKEDLEFLRDQEKGHKVFFERLLKTTGKEYKPNPGSALHIWVKDNLFSPVKKALDKGPIKTFKQALAIGIEVEEKSVIFYKELKKFAKDKESKDAIAQIIKEEQRHQKFLNAILRYSDLV